MSAIELLVHDRHAELRMSAPPVNAFSVPFLEELCDAVEALPATVIAVVLTSSNARVFAAGGDLPYMAGADIDRSRHYVALCQRAYSHFESERFVSIAAVDGACLAGGLELALACDIRIASRGARFGLPEVGLGILAGGGGIHRLVRAIGQGPARDMLLTGEPVSAEVAHMWGLASRLVNEDAAAAGRTLAEKLAGGAHEAISATKALALSASSEDYDAEFDRELREWLVVRGTVNAQEGLTSFGERRRPTYGARGE